MNDPHTRHPLTERNGTISLNDDLIKRINRIRADNPHYPNQRDYDRHMRVAMMNTRTVKY